MESTADRPEETDHAQSGTDVAAADRPSPLPGPVHPALPTARAEDEARQQTPVPAAEAAPDGWNGGPDMAPQRPSGAEQRRDVFEQPAWPDVPEEPAGRPESAHPDDPTEAKSPHEYGDEYGYEDEYDYGYEDDYGYGYGYRDEAVDQGVADPGDHASDEGEDDEGHLRVPDGQELLPASWPGFPEPETAAATTEPDGSAPALGANHVTHLDHAGPVAAGFASDGGAPAAGYRPTVLSRLDDEPAAGAACRAEGPAAEDRAADRSAYETAPDTEQDTAEPTTGGADHTVSRDGTRPHAVPAGDKTPAATVPAATVPEPTMPGAARAPLAAPEGESVLAERPHDARPEAGSRTEPVSRYTDTPAPDASAPDTPVPAATAPPAPAFPAHEHAIPEPGGPDAEGCYATGPHSAGPHSTGPYATGPHSTGPYATGRTYPGREPAIPRSLGQEPAGQELANPQTTGPEGANPRTADQEPASQEPPGQSPGSPPPPAPDPAAPHPRTPGPEQEAADTSVWNDGLIARRAPSAADARAARSAAGADLVRDARTGGTTAGPEHRGAGAAARAGGPYGAVPYGGARRPVLNRALTTRLEALRELVGLSRTRLDAGVLTEAGQVLDEAVARQRLSLDHTVVALAGASGSGKSTLFNALAGATLSEAGVCRPTTSAPLACTWSEGADGLLDRLGVPPSLRRRAPQHTPEQTLDHALEYASRHLPGHTPDDAARPTPDLRGLVLLDLPDHDSAVTDHRKQVDRLLGLVDAVVWVVDPEKYADAVLHERYLRPLAGYDEVTFVVLNQTDRLPGETTDQVLDDLRRLLDEDGLALGEHGEPGATVLALSALTGEGVADLREQLARFAERRGAAESRLAADVDGATKRLAPVCLADCWTGLSLRAREEFEDRLAASVGAVAAGQAAEREWLRLAELAYGAPWAQLWRWCRRKRPPKDAPVENPSGDVLPTGHASDGDAPADADRTPGRHGLTGHASTADAPAGLAPASHPGDAPAPDGCEPEPRTARAVVEQAVRTVAGEAAAGLPDPWARAVRESAVCGARLLPEALDEAAAVRAADSGRPTGPGWWAVASVAQGLLLALQATAAAWLVFSVLAEPNPGWLSPALLMAATVVAGPALSWGCRVAARGPARAYGDEAERRLRDAAASCGRSRVLEPVAAELLRYREARAQYTVAAGGSHRL